METETQAEQLNAIVDRLLDRDSSQRLTTILGQNAAPFDISRVNIHDSKKEFIKELTAVETVTNHLKGVLDQLGGKGKENDTQYKKMVDRLRTAIEKAALQQLRSSQVISACDLALRNMVDTGFYINSLLVQINMLHVYNQRLKELRDQEKQFWSVPYRAPNYYARTIALRLARLYANEKRLRPTFGISREGNHPSTDFGRALEEVFAVLEIGAAVRSAAEWAINQLTEDDLNPPAEFISGGLRAAMSGHPKLLRRNSLEEIAYLLTKGG